MKKPLYYTFGNHMHWVDFHWLWGYEVLPRSIRDMLELVESTGTRGCANFDGVGYEKLAAEDPEALAELRAAVEAGTIEIVGGSYGQPYGLFHGGESNVRQRIFGVRTVRRLFGVRPRAFWEEEFDFFPQLPQILASCGFEGASLFFQWTWHTPTVPEEEFALVRWEGLDGTRLPTVPKNELCLHQWPEDFAGRLDSALVEKLPRPAVVQWVELLPSPDWMCRAEVLRPPLEKLLADERFDVRPVTLTELIAALSAVGEIPGGEAPVRRYTLDDVFHGMSLGKNGDRMPRFSRIAEEQLLAAESISAAAGLFGRPYPAWDVYPTWELEEAWRELLAAQHHDNHECEALCGFVGERSFDRSIGLSEHVFRRTCRHLARRVRGLDGSVLVYNPLGWTRDVMFPGGVAPQVPAYGWRVLDPFEEAASPLGETKVESASDRVTLTRGALKMVVDLDTGTITDLRSAQYPDGLLDPRRPLGELAMTIGDETERFSEITFDRRIQTDPSRGEVTFRREGRHGGRIQVTYGIAGVQEGFYMRLVGEDLPRPEGGMHPGLQTLIAPDFAAFRLRHDHPYGVSAIEANRNHRRKYPTGEWMTSPQWFEEIRRPFTAQSFVDLLEVGGRGRGLLVVHDGGQAFFREEEGIRALMTMYDPWDEEHWDGTFDAAWWFLPHSSCSDTRRVRAAMECNLGNPRFATSCEVKGEGDLPPVFGSVFVDAPNVLVTAFYRESGYAAKGFSGHFAADVRDPHVVRLVEFDGEPAELTLRVPGPVARAARTTLMGEVIELLESHPVEPPYGGLPEGGDENWSGLTLTLRPHEIATVMLDLERARQEPRNLDAFRHVWATVHRGEQG